jgi:hypothetical protein
MATAEESDDDLSLEEVLKGFGEVTDAAGDLEEEAAALAKVLPGSEAKSNEIDEGPQPETNYADDGDLSKFMEFIHNQYPANIPQHDGRSMVGCEKAVTFLDKLNSRISMAIREDSDNTLDVQALEEVRVNIMSDILVLKNHLGKLKKKFKEDHEKKASLDENGIPRWTNKAGNEVEYKELTKEAGTPNNIVIAVSPFERAISGIMINAHISGGHPIEDVYGFLAKKYSIDDREELAIMQLCMDSGFHIYKDRGTYSPHNADSDKEDGKSGVDFLRNYFA